MWRNVHFDAYAVVCQNARLGHLSILFAVSKNIAPVNQAILHLALPAIAQSFLQTLIFLVDRALLGHYSTDALASLRLTGPVIWCVTGLLSSFAIGSVAVIGRAVGAGDRPLATAAARSSLLMALGIGSVASVICLLGLDALLSIFPAVTPDVEKAAKGFLTILLLAMPLQLVAITAAAMLQAAGNSRTPFLVALLANLVNFGLDYTLIFGRWGLPELGTVGAAIGSATAITLNAALLLLVLSKRDGELTWRSPSKGQEILALRRILKVSFPALGERMSRSVGYMGFTLMISALGSVAMATHEALIGIEEICFQSADGFGIAVAAIVAQRLGGNRPDEAIRGVKFSALIAVGLLGLFALVFLLIPTQLLGLFTTDRRILSLGVPCLMVAAIAQPFMAMSIILEQALRGAGDTQTALWVSLAGWFAVRLVATYSFVFVLGWGLPGVWMGSTCDWVVRSVLLVSVFRWRQWKQVAV